VIARILVAVLAGAVALPGVATAAPPLSPRSIVKRLNAERTRAGLPARVTEVPGWSARCAAHNRWMSANEIAHDEAPGTEDYSEAGDWAGTHSVLAQGTSWREGNPWADAPLHLTQLLDPDLRRVGASDAFGASCVTTWPGMRPGQARRIWTVPRNGGRAPVSQHAWEAPFTPQERVGIPAEQVTGPYLYVWSDGFEELVDGWLLGPDESVVETKVIDNADVAGTAGVGNGWLLPVEPLQADTRYTATVILHGPDGEFSRSWSFTTT
jgi:hypothetical protein